MKVIRLVLKNVDHPVAGIIERYVYSLLHRDGGPYTLSEKRFVSDVIAPLFQVSTADPSDPRFLDRHKEIRRLQSEDLWKDGVERIAFFGGLERFNKLVRFIRDRVNVLKHRAEWRDTSATSVANAAELLAAFILNPEDIDNLDEIDSSHPAARQAI